MKIPLRIEEKNIYVKCKIKTNGLSMVFNLARSLTIDRIVTEDGHPLAYKRREFEEDFLPPLQQIEIESNTLDELEVHYHGPLEGRFLYLNEGLIHFSL